MFESGLFPVCLSQILQERGSRMWRDPELNNSLSATTTLLSNIFFTFHKPPSTFYCHHHDHPPLPFSSGVPFHSGCCWHPPQSFSAATWPWLVVSSLLLHFGRETTGSGLFLVAAFCWTVWQERRLRRQHAGLLFSVGRTELPGIIVSISTSILDLHHRYQTGYFLLSYTSGSVDLAETSSGLSKDIKEWKHSTYWPREHRLLCRWSPRRSSRRRMMHGPITHYELTWSGIFSANQEVSSGSFWSVRKEHTWLKNGLTYTSVQFVKACEESI